MKKYDVGPRLGEVLLKEKLISEQGISDSLQEQASVRKRTIGEYLRSKAVVTAHELEGALERQKSFPHLKLGEILIGEGLITETQLEQALTEQKQNRNKPLGEILVDRGLITADAVQLCLAKKMGTPYVDLKRFEVQPEVAQLVTEELARRHHLLPLCRFGQKLAVAIENPLDWKAINALQFHTKLTIEPVMAAADEIRRAIDAQYASLNMEEMGSEEIEASVGAYEEPTELTETSASDNVVVRLINKIIIDAYHRGASDIHIEPLPGREKTRIRLRKDGLLLRYLEVPPQLRNALVARIKIMARLNIAERRRPQDGKIDFSRYAKLKIELRVATLPTAGDLEDVVMRILAGGSARPLNDMGFGQEQLVTLKRLIQVPYGLLLVCGPTGSGKTTTLHSVLRELNTAERKIWTVEDPVEITQTGLRQLQVNPQINLTFANAMRAFLRADPDIIMVGEMRDAETISTAIEASLTGHMVFSTMHTNSAPESITRLLDMGMDPFNFADALVGVLAQRLTRRLCPECKTAYRPEPAEIDALLREYCHDFKFSDPAEAERLIGETRQRWLETYADRAGGFQLYRATGCDQCNQTGYAGRIGLYELMEATPAVKQLIVRHAPVAELAQLALREGMRSLRQNGIEKVLAGQTDISQVRRVCAG
ncbi:MAG: Flp pilus assembly complex ATPase component TadA [Gammaproteobacteria bacterium]|nr:Flp pilus assembly complex ATPase component TadA [Gammaproteobacteria bacterium]MBU1654808.1 Flp pilus assembly complex ATPase component TadA [Gammaproteobacteria bacterium]MBU1960549.1 Flp pilus assembly complex ATPase component TadA [Gammaproteobacteria bacterium]